MKGGGANVGAAELHDRCCPFVRYLGKKSPDNVKGLFVTGTGTRETSLKERACDMIKPRVVSYWLSQNSESRELRTAHERQAYSPCGYFISLLPAIDGVVYPKLGIKKALTFGIGNRRTRSS